MSRTSAPRRDLPNVDGYTVEEQIDSGGFSRVYRAIQHGLERQVAIKVLNASFEDERQQRTFERECRVMGQLSTHQNIVTVFESAVTADEHPCIVMELYAGTYRGEEQLDIAEVVDVGAKVADALQAIHDRGIVHRDIKPHNIFVSTHGQPAIGDFGISSIESERTVTGGAGFSINYAPPEVFEEGGAGAAGDIYSLGATLYQLATGEVPFPHTGEPAEKTRATVHKIIATPPPSLRRSDAPPELDRLLQRCMSKDAASRPASAAEVAAKLRQIQAGVGHPDPALRLARVATTPPLSEATARRRVDRDAPPPPDADGTSGNVTVVRDRARPADPDVDTPVDEAPPRRALLTALGLGLAVIAVSAAAIAFNLFGGDGDDETPTTTEAETTAPSGDDFVVLRPPDDLTVVRSSDATYDLTWTAAQPNVEYQVVLVGADETRFSETTTYTWRFDDDPGTACFEVRTVNAERTRVSQSADGPECASG